MCKVSISFLFVTDIKFWCYVLAWSFEFSRQLVRLNSALQVAESLMQMLLLKFEFLVKQY